MRFQRPHVWILATASCLLSCTSVWNAAAARELSEHDFLGELPVVLSASRLVQPLADAPGAVTIIDRDLIKASGAREITDLLRLVPGFQVSTYHGSSSRPVVAYHGLADEYSRQMQVLVDGRSAYSPYSLGSVDWNTLRLSLDDIERIEVVRGSNSATYGANAFLGVINIVTRHPGQSQGAYASTTHGNRGIEDHVLRFGGKLGDAHYRISAGRRSDNGFANSHDSRQIDYVAFRGDMRLSHSDEIQLQFGASHSAQGVGFAGSQGNPLRTPREGGHYVQAVWKRALGPDEELSINAYHMRDDGQEKLFVRGGPLIAFVDADRQTKRSHLEIQHIFRINQAARMVWGLEDRHETVASRWMFDSYDPKAISLRRLFGNLEWRLAPQWLLNAGAMLERHSFTGTDLAPRVMLNFQPVPGQTFRIGMTTANRTPSLYEEKGNVKYYAINFPVVVTGLQARGGLKPESIRTRELSYLGEFPSIGLSIDARAFHEHVSRIIDEKSNNYLNRWDALNRGLEYQVRWAPSPETLILFNQTRMRIDSEDGRVADSAPRRSTTLFASHRFPFGLQTSLVHHWIGGFRWAGGNYGALPMQRRLDFRLAYPFRSGPARYEVAWVSQAVRHSYTEFTPGYVFERRNFVTLSLEF
jgi:iron complex outermembrane receptor protein